MSALKPLIENVPQCLRDLPQWVCWRYVERDGKRTKVPIDARTGRNARATDPATWATFESAHDAYLRSEPLAGVGFVFTKDDPLLSETGKSVDDLRKDVETYQQRMELKAAVAAVPNLQNERQTLDEQIAAADRALRAAEDLHDETTQPLHFRRQQVIAAINEAERSHHKLVATCDDPDLLREKEELEAEILKVHQRRLEQQERENFMDSYASRERQNAQCESWPVEVNRRLEVAQQYQANGDATRRAINDLDKELRKLEKRREEVEEWMRKF